MKHNSVGRKLAIGAASGAAATIPMSWAMEVMHQLLPPHEQQPLPPREITERITSLMRIGDRLSNEQRMWIALASHFGYGAAVGSVYQTIAPSVPMHPLAKGTAYGLAVWAGSYLGLLPGLGILTPATRHRARRNLLMIAAHLVWGSALGLVTDLLQRGSRGQVQFLDERHEADVNSAEIPAGARV